MPVSRNHRAWLVAAMAGAALFFTGASVHAADRALSGQALYTKHCVKCHGKAGEGVSGKYDEALHGDWSIEKLTRVIDRTMPEGAPERLDATQSEAVARYVYDAFYSREARARNHPQRVELVRLTNRQLMNTVADLLWHVSGSSDTFPGKERGLRATYYDSRGFGKKAFDRLDAQVNFDFGAGSPDAERIKPEEFSMRWQGSLLAEESGDYEFVVKTPNGMRLWVNSAADPTIDAWVTSGQSEHRARVKLIGGRVYPLMLDLFKYKDKTASVSLWWKPPHGAEQLIPTRNLAPVQGRATFVPSTPFPADDSSLGYERGLGVSKAWEDASTQLAIEVANHVLKQLDRYSRSKPTDADRAAKVQAFCLDLVQTAFRRPLNEEQKRQFVTAHFAAGVDEEAAVKRVIFLTLKSPRFWYLGLEGDQPDAYAVAARLSYGLWDSLPDRELWKRAAEGQLATVEQVGAQAQRMLNNPRTRGKVQHFLHHWLHMSHIEDLSKDPNLYPGFTPEIIADLRTSLNLFLDDVVWGASSDYRQLLLAEHLYVNDRLAKFYGVTGVTNGADYVRVKLDPKQRSGVVTHPYLLAAFSYQKSTSPIHRGVFLTRNIIGRALKPPPVAISFNEADFAPNLSMREKVVELTKGQACQTCHSVINPLGFSLELYDAVGRFRTAENGKPVNAVSDYITDDGEKVRLTGARDLAEFAVKSDLAHNGFVEQLFHQVVKQPMMAYGGDLLNRLRGSFAASGYNIQKLLVEIATTAAWHGTDPKNSNPKKT